MDKVDNVTIDYVEETGLPEHISEQLIGLYLKHTPKDLELLMDAIASDDPAKMKFHAHKLCATMKIMGFSAIVGLLEEIEHEHIEKEAITDQGVVLNDLIQDTFSVLERMLK